jgi:hypothetical protein
MIPNRFPDEGEAPEYNTVDATLWYFEAIRAYYAATGDDALLDDLFPVLQEISSPGTSAAHATRSTSTPAMGFSTPASRECSSPGWTPRSTTGSSPRASANR